MSSFSLNEHIRRNITFPEPYQRLVSLEAARVAVEEQLAHLKGQHAIRLYARLRRNAQEFAPDDIECEDEGLKSTVEELFPKVFRGGFLISLWSVFEACIKNIAEYVRRDKNLPFGLQDLRAGDFLQQTDKFFLGVLGIKAFPDKAVRRKLEQIKGLRNALVHHDGSVDELPDSLKSKSEAEYLKKGLIICADLHHKYAVPTAAYAEESLATVRTHLELLAQLVYAKVHPIPLKDDA